MPLEAGTYFIKNSSNGQYIMPCPGDQPPNAHASVVTRRGPLSDAARVEVSVDSNGLYSLSSANHKLQIAQSKDDSILIWDAGIYLWRITEGDDGLFAWEPPSGQLTGNDTSSFNPGSILIALNGSSEEICAGIPEHDAEMPIWEFIDAASV